jgi:hypothetical protein
VDENPYQSPLADLRPAVGVLSGQHRDVRAVAVYQKGILVCILVYLLTILVQLVAISAAPSPVSARLIALVAGLVSLGAGLAGMVFVFLLSTKVFGIVLGILLGILTVVPCLGLLVLLIINGKATSVLRQNGHRVGLLGARLSEFDNR